MLLHKPAGVVTTASDPQGRPTVVDLVDHPTRVVPVGRLDADTTGALLLTNDGELAHRLAHPRYGVEKVYVAEVEGEPSTMTRCDARDGVELDDGRTAPARVRRLGRGRVELVLHEGRKHQVKRMLEAVGHPVRRAAPVALRGRSSSTTSRPASGASSPRRGGELRRTVGQASLGRTKPIALVHPARASARAVAACLVGADARAGGASSRLVAP